MAPCSPTQNRAQGLGFLCFCFQSRRKPSKNYALQLLNKSNQWKPCGKILRWQRTYLGLIPTDENQGSSLWLSLQAPHGWEASPRASSLQSVAWTVTCWTSKSPQRSPMCPHHSPQGNHLTSRSLLLSLSVCFCFSQPLPLSPLCSPLSSRLQLLFLSVLLPAPSCSSPFHKKPQINPISLLSCFNPFKVLLPKLERNPTAMRWPVEGPRGGRPLPRALQPHFLSSSELSNLIPGSQQPLLMQFPHTHPCPQIRLYSPGLFSFGRQLSAISERPSERALPLLDFLSLYLVVDTWTAFPTCMEPACVAPLSMYYDGVQSWLRLPVTEE